MKMPFCQRKENMNFKEKYGIIVNCLQIINKVLHCIFKPVLYRKRWQKIQTATFKFNEFMSNSHNLHPHGSGIDSENWRITNFKKDIRFC